MIHSSWSCTCKRVVSGSEAHASGNGQELNTPLVRQQKKQAVTYRAKNNCNALSLPQLQQNGAPSADDQIHLWHSSDLRMH